MSSGITVAVVGLNFGEEFVPIYMSHPNVADVVLVEPDAERRHAIAQRYGLADGHADLTDALADASVDAVHVLAPVYLHADMVVAALRAGKHVASAVPMATTLDDCDRVIAAQQESGRNYMMMETTVFAREYLHVEEMVKRGDFGALTLYRGFHIQNLDGFPVYWQGYPPMHYITHALSPVLALLGTGVETVRCMGAGTLASARDLGGFDNPYPTEVGLFTLRDSDVLADITMSLFQTARSYVEGFALYGEHVGVEWPRDNEGPLTFHHMSGPAEGHRGNQVATREVEPADMLERLPEPLRVFTRPGEVQLPGMAAPAPLPAHHGGSHPFLAHEFVSSIVENRAPFIDAHTAARWTAPGICAHQSALSGGTVVKVPMY
ncbi:MAG: Gfo/Idh/MocA family protein [Streptosporangiales bacterium]